MYYKIILAYEGTNYCGWERQRNGERTVQGTVITTLLTQFPLSPEREEMVQLLGAGRTDKGVHALGQCARLFHPTIQLEGVALQRWLNAMLPPDIRILNVTPTDVNFQPRYAPHQKVYEYKIDTRPLANNGEAIFTRHLVYHYGQPIRVQKIRAVLPLFIGEHDFLSYSTSELPEGATTRKIYSFTVHQHHHQVIFQIAGNGFLKNMVRMLVGTLLAYQAGKVSLADLRRWLAHPQKGAAHWKAPPQGLYLKAVHYEVDTESRSQGNGENPL